MQFHSLNSTLDGRECIAPLLQRLCPPGKRPLFPLSATQTPLRRFQVRKEKSLAPSRNRTKIRRFPNLYPSHYADKKLPHSVLPEKLLLLHTPSTPLSYCPPFPSFFAFLPSFSISFNIHWVFRAHISGYQFIWLQWINWWPMRHWWPRWRYIISIVGNGRRNMRVKFGRCVYYHVSYINRVTWAAFRISCTAPWFSDCTSCTGFYVAPFLGTPIILSRPITCNKVMWLVLITNSHVAVKSLLSFERKVISSDRC